MAALGAWLGWSLLSGGKKKSDGGNGHDRPGDKADD